MNTLKNWAIGLSAALLLSVNNWGCNDVLESDTTDAETVVVPGVSATTVAPDYTEVMDLRPENEIIINYGLSCGLGDDGKTHCEDRMVVEGRNIPAFLRRHAARMNGKGDVEKQECFTPGECDPCNYGVGCIVPDNAYHTYCNYESPQNSSLGALHQGVADEVSLIKNQLEGWNHGGNDTGYTLAWKAPWRGKPTVCSGYDDIPNVASGWLPLTLDNPVMVDIAFQRKTLANTPNSYCGLPRCPGPDCTSYKGQPWMACTRMRGATSQLSWSNGANPVPQAFVRTAGGYITFDSSVIELFANNLSDNTDLATSRNWMYRHITCHEVGHSLGLVHSGTEIRGAFGTPQWEPENVWQGTCMSSVQPNPEATASNYDQTQELDELTNTTRASWFDGHLVPRGRLAPPVGNNEF
jgi:hypothetical protein